MSAVSWPKLRPFWCHSKALRSKKRWVFLRAGRRSGKTEVSKRKLVLALAEKKNHSLAPRYFYAGPTMSQAREVAWEDLKDLTPDSWISDISETRLKITTRFGSSLQVIGLDKAHRTEGGGFDGGVVDERADVKPEAISRSIIPAMTDRNGWLWQIGVPKRFGVGAASYNQAFDDAKTGKMKNALALEWPSSAILTAEQLEDVKANMTQEDFEEQFEAKLVTVGGQVYYAFSDGVNGNVQTCQYDESLPIVVGMDFNVDPMSWVLCHDINGTLYVFDILYRRNTHTKQCLDRLYAKYMLHTSGWHFYGDASSKARKTASPVTDLLIIKNDTRFLRKKVMFPKKNPNVEDRLNASNAMYLNAHGRRRIQIDPSLTTLITDIKNRSRKEGKRELDDGKFQGHLCDALDYICYARYPVRMNPTFGKSTPVVVSR